MPGFTLNRGPSVPPRLSCGHIYIPACRWPVPITPVLTRISVLHDTQLYSSSTLSHPARPVSGPLSLSFPLQACLEDPTCRLGALSPQRVKKLLTVSRICGSERAASTAEKYQGTVRSRQRPQLADSPRASEMKHPHPQPLRP